MLAANQTEVASADRAASKSGGRASVRAALTGVVTGVVGDVLVAVLVAEREEDEPLAVPDNWAIVESPVCKPTVTVSTGYS